MALWDKLKTELDRAGRAAQTVIDDGKVRLDVMRVRQLADKTAEALGYAVFHARQKGEELDADSYARLSSTLAAHEAEVERREGHIARAAESAAPASAASDGESSAAGGATTASPSATEAPAAAASSGSASSASPAAGPTTRVDPAMGDDPERNVTGGF